MGTNCSTAEKATSESIVASGKKQTTPGPSRCKTCRRCSPEEKIQPEVTTITNPSQKGKALRQPSRADSTASTRAPSDGDLESAGEPETGKPKADPIRLDKNMRKFRKVARAVVGELNHFQVWVKRHYSNTADAFDALVGDSRSMQIEYHTFVYNLEIQGFKGRGDNVFYGLCDEHSWSDGLVITRQAFMARLANMGTPLLVVVQQAIATNQKKIKQRLAKKRRTTMKQDDIDQVVFFRNFIEKKHASPEKTFDAVAGDDGCIDQEEFTGWLKGLNFPGDAAKVFTCFCDADGIITRMVFCELLAKCKQMKPETGGDVDAEEQGKKDDAKETSGAPEAEKTKSAGLGRARTLSLADAVAAQAKSPSNSEASTATGGTAPEEFDEETRAGKSEPATSKGSGRRKSRSNSITSMDGDAAAPESEKGAPKIDRKKSRSNSITSMDSERAPKATRKKSKESPSTDGDPAAPDSEKGAPKLTRRKSRSNSITSMDGDSAAPKPSRRKSRSNSITSMDSERAPKATRKKTKELPSSDGDPAAPVPGAGPKSLFEQLCDDPDENGAANPQDQDNVKEPKGAAKKKSRNDQRRKSI